MPGETFQVLTEHTTVDDAEIARPLLEEGVLRFCQFSSFSLDGGNVETLADGCEFTSIEWYWTLFNCATFVDSSFQDCTFRGISFASCRFVECTFKNCRFIQDNLGGKCSAPGSSFYGCTELNCEGWAELLKTSSATSKNLNESALADD